MANRLPEPTHLPIASLVQDHPVDRIANVIRPRCSLRRTGLDAVEGSRAIIQLHPSQQLPYCLRPRLTPEPDEVFALDPAGWMHQPVRQLTVGSKEQQPSSIDVQAPNHDPAPVPWDGQAVEDRGTAPGITPGGHLADGLVIEERLLRPRLHKLKIKSATVEANLLPSAGPVAELREAPAHREPPLADPLLHLAPRADPGGGN